MIGESSSPRARRPPFNDQDADLIIRSSDQVHFHVHKLILAKASPVFRDMMTLPQSSTGSEGLDPPVVDVTEHSKTLDMLLCLSYPTTPPFQGLDGLWQVLEAASKYQMDSAREHVRNYLSGFVHEAPMRVYALACGYGFDDLAQTVAAHTLSAPDALLQEANVEELELISARTYDRLLRYRQRCSDAASAVTDVPRWCRTPHWIPNCNNPDIFAFFQCQECANRRHKLWISGCHRYPTSYWLEYMERTKAALKTQPHAPVVSSSAMLLPVVQHASKCSFCSERIMDDLMRFAELLEQEVARVVSEVKLSL
ncbi:uncharacterized protein LAESUDRAFT_455627 [Laetiporus sulphureus 93-53]|uniref:BTB domain-containing protein n=1 Tax=Laetiporus sulphureus 93-53 TaxID=1314785 RepID=A0A165BT32_9APHY|nr:uncharacterized protein LAESUDRAFT_455627 [Laetiporus sulphureus 93-53]KZT01599.1 hypothetical protein LAESUDRAFT_455627 [Laetiporus sulphureus 93-53]